MTLTEQAGADDRWAAAEGLADGVLDADLGHRRRRVLWLLLSVMAASILLGIVTALLLPRAEPSAAQSSGLAGTYILGLGITFLGILVSVVGFIWAKRTGRYIVRWRQVASPLNWSERRQAMKQIRGKAPAHEKRIRVLRAIAVQLRKTTLGISPLLGGIILIVAGQIVFLGAPTGLQFLFAGTMLLFAVTAALMARDYRRAGRFLRGHQPTDSSAG